MTASVPAGATYRDPSRPVDERVADLLRRMTLDEKVRQLGCFWITELVRGDTFDPDAAAEKLAGGIGHVTRIGASTGLRPAASAALMNEIQRVAVERTRLGIPVLVHEESTGGFCARDATAFPTGLGLAATWDPDLVEAVASVIREQMRAVGARHTLAPVLDIARDPRWGRVEETYGEDPVLSGTMGVAYVRGAQTDDLAAGVVCTGKHFLGYGLSEGGMNHAPVHLGPRELRDVFAEPFAAAIRDAGLASVMNSYSSVDGVPVAASEELLTGLLRDELGFDGVVVADYFSLDLLRSHHRLTSDAGAAAAMALTAGLDMELPSLQAYGEPLKAEIRAGRVSMDTVDRSVARALAVKFRLGLFEDPYVDADEAATVYQTPAQRDLARRAAAESVVVLTNDGVLPLASGTSVAVIGPGADDRRLLQGDYHYPAHLEMIYEGALPVPEQDLDIAAEAGEGIQFLPEAGGAFRPGPFFAPHITPLAGLRVALGDDAVSHARGCDISGDDRSGFDEAVRAARAADVAVVVVAGRSGLTVPCTVGEARDAVSLDLTGVQRDLVAAVAASGTPTVVVVLSGRVHTLAAEADTAAALVQVFPPGEQGGSGLADVLTGAVDATGRLPVTLPRHVGQVPIYGNHRAGGGMSQFYGDYTDSSAGPLFPFGHGLSYTTFTHRGLQIVPGSTTEATTVRLTVENTGARAGTDVVQLFATDVEASVARPLRQLIGFARVDLGPGGSVPVTFEVHPSRLAYHDQRVDLVTEPGAVTFAVGRSIADITVAETVELGGASTIHRQRDIVATQVRIGVAVDARATTVDRPASSTGEPVAVRRKRSLHKESKALHRVPLRPIGRSEQPQRQTYGMQRRSQKRRSTTRRPKEA